MLNANIYAAFHLVGKDLREQCTKKTSNVIMMQFSSSKYIKCISCQGFAMDPTIPTLPSTF